MTSKVKILLESPSFDSSDIQLIDDFIDSRSRNYKAYKLSHFPYHRI